MRYPYRCASCAHEFDVIKSVAEIDNPEACPSCASAETRRFITRTHFYGAGEWDYQGFCPGLGTHIKSRSHRKAVARAKGAEEIGNEPPEKMHKHYEKEREEKFERRWASV